MKPQLKNIAIALALVFSVSACSSTDSSSARSVYGFSGDDLRSPKSHHVNGRGSRSKEFVAAGKQHFEAQNYGLAEKAFRKAVEIRTDDASAWMGLAASYDQLGRFDFADRAYEQLVDLKGNSPRVLNNMGYSQLLRGNYQKAASYLNKAQEMNPSLEEVQGNIHLLQKISAS